MAVENADVEPIKRAGVQFRQINLDLLGDVMTNDNGWLAVQLWRAMRGLRYRLTQERLKNKKTLGKHYTMKGSSTAEQNKRRNLKNEQERLHASKLCYAKQLCC